MAPSWPTLTLRRRRSPRHFLSNNALTVDGWFQVVTCSFFLVSRVRGFLVGRVSKVNSPVVRSTVRSRNLTLDPEVGDGVSQKIKKVGHCLCCL